MVIVRCYMALVTCRVVSKNYCTEEIFHKANAIDWMVSDENKNEGNNNGNKETKQKDFQD